MDPTFSCNFPAITFWFEIVFASVGWLSLILSIVFLSMAIHHENSGRKEAKSALLVARTTRPRPIYVPPTPPSTNIHTPPVIQQPPVMTRPTELPIKDPYMPKVATPVDQVRMIMPPPSHNPRNGIAPNAFTYLPNGMLNPETNNFMGPPMTSSGPGWSTPPTSGWTSAPPPVAPRGYINSGYEN